MLELKNIHKDYPAGDSVVHALKGIDLKFRKSEFVAMLGPSGCGKTTMLNIIGGLDRYTKGDLIINGQSTESFRDRNWDAYRNHSVGFVFQSYNLIAHSSVLHNVELALTLSGVGKAERRKRAIAALESVGLGDQLKKRPNQLSGGQMQRVAIARALVNDPDIILADEPTGALDSETSVQVMDILKEVAKKRLVVMVTHNPELAEQYATRIIRMLDGVIIADSHPISLEECAATAADGQEKPGKRKMPAMKWRTAFGLSLKNLIAKINRTMLTSFAGSIGIIGIALIYAVSQGMSSFINTVQEDTLSSYPLSIQQTNVDLGSMMMSFLESAASDKEHEKDAVYPKGMVYDLINAINNMDVSENDLVAFKAYLEKQLADPESVLSQALSGVQYSYELNLPVFTKNVDGSIIKSDAQLLLQKLMMEHMRADVSSMNQSGTGMMGGMMGGSSYQVWQEMLPGKEGQTVGDLLKKQYDVVYGEWPNDYNEIVLVVDENNEVDDMTLYALGLKSEADMNAIMEAAINGTSIEAKKESWSYQEICNMEFHVVLPGDCYTKDPVSGLYTDLSETDAGLRYLYDNGLVLEVTGIIRPNEEAVSAMMTGSIGYTSDLTRYVIENSRNCASVRDQLATPDMDVITGLPFKSTTGSLTAQQKEEEFRRYVSSLEQTGLAEVYVKIMSIPSEETLAAAVEQSMTDLSVEDMRAQLLQALTAQMGMRESEVEDYLSAMADEEVAEIFEQMVRQQTAHQYAQQVQAQLASKSEAELAGALSIALESYTQEQFAIYYDQVLEFSDATYEDNLVLLGCLDLDEPSAVHLYSVSFNSKDLVEEAIENYNSQVDELQQISYTDYIGLMMSSITTIINAITYVLIAFVAISLVVSSIMIGVITLISVQERTKEIGILRAIGASKRNVSNMFNAETVLIGASSGIIGVLVTYLLCIPINALIFNLTGIAGLKAYLPWQVALVLVFVSIVLSVFSGFIPAGSAAKKDPVVALRID